MHLHALSLAPSTRERKRTFGDEAWITICRFLEYNEIAGDTLERLERGGARAGG